MSFRRWENGKVIGHTQLVPDFRQTFKAPYYVIHRAHFHEALHKRAIDLGVDVKVNQRVVDYDLQTPSVKTANGKLYSADLIIAADGKTPILLLFDIENVSKTRLSHPNRSQIKCSEVSSQWKGQRAKAHWICSISGNSSCGEDES
jgi:hypothetical protein